MEIRVEAVQILRQVFRDGVTIGHLVDTLVSLYHRRSEPLSDLELVWCFEEAFDLNIRAGNGYLLARLHGRRDGISEGAATTYIFPKILQSRDTWDPLESRQGRTTWLDTLPPIAPANVPEIENPRFAEWDDLSEASKKYVNRLARSGSFYGQALELVACLAEHLQSKLDADHNRSTAQDSAEGTTTGLV